MNTLPAIKLNVLKEKIVTWKSPTIREEFVHTNLIFLKLYYRLCTSSFFQTVQLSQATPCKWGFLTSLTIKSNEMILPNFRLYSFFLLTSTDKKCDIARVY